MSSNPVTAWAGALDDLEAQLLEHLEFLSSDEERDAPAPMAPPQGLPPIPDELRPRAQQLLDAVRIVTNELQAEHDRIAIELQRLRRVTRPQAGGPEAIDTRA